CFVGARFFAKGQEPAPARALPRVTIYHPDAPVSELSRWQRAWQSDAPVVALLFYRAHLQAGNLAAFDGLIAKLVAAQLNPLPIAVASLEDELGRGAVEELLQRTDASLVLNTTGLAIASFADAGGSSGGALGLGRPVLQVIVSGGNIDDWREQPTGLAARDL